jgi:predicted flap endonuclease-1-like 5' DNA nuclease
MPVPVSYPIKNIDGMDADTVCALKAVGIRTTAKLLEAARSAKGRKRLADKTGLSEERLLQLANMADQMRVKGLGADYAELLRECGVKTVRSLKYRNPAKLATAMRKLNDKRKLVKLVPSDKTVGDWIDQAKKLPLKITY